MKVGINLLQINPYKINSPIVEISNKICQILKKFQPSQTQHLEIQFKYAEFVAFANSYFTQQPLPNVDTRKKVLQVCSKYVGQQNAMHLATIKKMSNMRSRVYKLCGGYNQSQHKNFYRIREFLINLCAYNTKSNIHSNSTNFYQNVQKTRNNKTFKMHKGSQLRLDLQIQDGECAGRYSYEVGKGWTKTNKENLLREELDIIMAQKTFRLGIKKQVEIDQTTDDVLSALNESSSAKGRVFIRIKRAIRVIKNEQIEIALSQIYQPDQERRSQFVEDLKDILLCDSSILDEFCQNVFQEFYMWEPKPNENVPFQDLVCKFQIESEYTKNGLKKLNQLRSKDFALVIVYVKETIEDLWALFFADHNIKKRQSSVLGNLLKKKQQHEEVKMQGTLLDIAHQCRLQNQYGSYMHDLLHQYMT